MGKKLSFAIAINLLTEQFKRGANQVKATFKALQMQILTFVVKTRRISQLSSGFTVVVWKVEINLFPKN